MPSKEAEPRPFPFSRHVGRHAHHIRGILMRRDKRPAQGVLNRRLQRRDAGSRRRHPTNTR